MIYSVCRTIVQRQRR